MASLLGGIAYAALGFYYGQGDPVAWMPDRPSGSTPLWIPFILLSPFASYYAFRSYVLLNENWNPSPSLFVRLRTLCLTLGLALCAYGGLYSLTAQASVAMDAPRADFHRAREEVKKQKTEQLARTLRESHPEWSAEEIRLYMEKEPVTVREHEVPRKFPLKPVIALLFLAGAVLAAGRPQRSDGGRRPAITPRTVAPAVLLSALVLALLMGTGGWVYR
jgi:hypothetical protein